MCHLIGLNATPSQPLPHEVRFLLHSGSEAAAPKGRTLCAASVPVLSNHPLGMCVLFTAQIFWLTLCLHCYLLYKFKTGLKKWTEMNKNQERNTKNELKAIVNRYVLRSDLKEVTASFRSLGREF